MTECTLKAPMYPGVRFLDSVCNGLFLEDSQTIPTWLVSWCRALIPVSHTPVAFSSLEPSRVRLTTSPPPGLGAQVAYGLRSIRKGK